MRGRLTLWAVAVVLTVALVGFSLRFMDPFPPARILLATGQTGGAYDSTSATSITAACTSPSC